MYVLGMYDCILYLGERWRSHKGHEIANLKLEKPKILAFQSSSLRFRALANGFANVPPSTKYNRTFPRRTFPIGNSRFKSSPLKSHVCAVLPLKQRQCVRSPQPHHRGPCRPHHRGPSPYARRLQHRGRRCLVKNCSWRPGATICNAIFKFAI